MKKQIISNNFKFGIQFDKSRDAVTLSNETGTENQVDYLSEIFRKN